ncbi:hypothetical protein LL963_01290 [Xanthomonas campestris pv. esculenti]|nr:hypothetical protein [Xanthomonas campestris pv. esculenti]
MHALNFFLNANVFTLEEGNKALRDSLERLEDDLKPLGIKGRQYFRSLLFLDLISEVELYFSAVIREVLLEHPKKLGNTQLKLSEVVDASSIDELIGRAADEFLYKLLYKRPGEYLTGMCAILSIDEASLTAYWPVYVEAKARRDLGTHNDWKCNDTYLRKLGEAGIESSAAVGESLHPVDGYFDKVLEEMVAMIDALADAIVAKRS